MREPQHFVFALVEDFTHLAFACAVDPLRIANLVSGRELYRWSYASQDGRTATGSDGAAIVVHHAFNTLPSCARLFVISGLNMRQKDYRGLVAALRQIDRTGKTRIGALCSGAYVLAKAGLLRDQHAAIHWEYHESFMAEFPDVKLVPNVFVADGKYVTASGGTATADLMLNLIEREHGLDLAIAVSDQMVYNAVRNSSSAQKVSFQSRNGIRNPHLVRTIEIMRAHLAEPLSHAEIARRVGLSNRQLERLFGKLLGVTPKKYFVDMRLEKARYLLLQTELSVTEIALSCGFDNPGSFSRSYKAAFGATPTKQRSRLD